MGFNIKVNVLNNYVDYIKGFSFFKESGYNILKKGDKLYMLPNGNASLDNDTLYINGSAINVDTPELIYQVYQEVEV